AQHRHEDAGDRPGLAASRGGRAEERYAAVVKRTRFAEGSTTAKPPASSVRLTSPCSRRPTTSSRSGRAGSSTVKRSRPADPGGAGRAPLPAHVLRPRWG